MKYNRLAFIHIEKAGGTTLIHMLRSSFGIRHFDILARDQKSHYIRKVDLDTVFRLCPSAVSLSGHAIRPCYDAGVMNYKGLKFYTLMREPFARYVSDFKHFAPCFNNTQSFEQWLNVKERTNFMTKAIAGEPNIDKAIDIINKKIVLVGLVEGFDEFIKHLILLFYPNRLSANYQIKNRSNNRYEGKLNFIYAKLKKIETGQKYNFHVDFNKYKDCIFQNNELDIKLFQYVKGHIIPKQKKRFDNLYNSLEPIQKGQCDNIVHGIRFGMNRVFRNLVYKPLLGYFPVPTKLEMYKDV